MTARRRPRHRPLLKVPVHGWNVTVYVRPGPRPGQYEVDPGFAPAPDGGLHRAGDSTRAIGRRAAVRAAQHAARRHKETEPPGRVPDGRVLKFGHGQWAVNHAPRYSFGCSLSRHPHGTYVLASPSFLYGDEWRHWWERAYRSRRDAVSAFQWGRRYVPTGEVARAFRKADHPIA